MPSRSLGFWVELLITLWTNCRSMDAGSMLCPKYSLILVTRFATSFGFPPRSYVLCGSPHQIICLTWRAVRQMGHCPVSSYLKSMCMSSAVNHRWEFYNFGYWIEFEIVSSNYQMTKIVISSSESELVQKLKEVRVKILFRFKWPHRPSQLCCSLHWLIFRVTQYYNYLMRCNSSPSNIIHVL